MYPREGGSNIFMILTIQMMGAKSVHILTMTFVSTAVKKDIGLDIVGNEYKYIYFYELTHICNRCADLFHRINTAVIV